MRMVMSQFLRIRLKQGFCDAAASRCATAGATKAAKVLPVSPDATNVQHVNGQVSLRSCHGQLLIELDNWRISIGLGHDTHLDVLHALQLCRFFFCRNRVIVRLLYGHVGCRGASHGQPP